MPRILFSLILVLAALPALAAGTSLETAAGPVYLHIAGADSRCTIEAADGGEVRRAVCAAGGESVVATSAAGCESLDGAGYCGSVPPGDTPIVGFELPCANGAGYFLLAGPGPIRCEREGEGAACASADGASAAAASCESGCKNTLGAGVCCMSDSDGCPPGLDRE